MAGRLVRLLEAAVAEPERAIGSLDILSAEERHTILREWNDTAHAIPSATLPELFAAQVAKSPDAIAVVFEDETPQLWRARCARQSAGASSARSRGRPRDGGGAVRRALARDGDRAARHPQGGRRLSAARSRPTRPSGWPSCWRMPARRCWSPSRRCSTGCPRTAPASCGSMPTGRAIARHPTTAPAARARPAKHRLRHLHLGVHRSAKRGRRSRTGTSCNSCWQPTIACQHFWHGVSAPFCVIELRCSVWEISAALFMAARIDGRDRCGQPQSPMEFLRLHCDAEGDTHSRHLAVDS